MVKDVFSTISALAVLSLFPWRVADALDAGKVNGQDDTIMQQSIRSTKQQMDREMLNDLYRDAQEAYHDGRYDDALELLDKINSLSPNYKDVGSLRRAIQQKAGQQTTAVDMDSVRDFMRQGDEASRSGQNALAISFWKKALDLDPNYIAAQKQIQRTNKILAQKEYDQGYLYYHQNDSENALDSWSNAVALDPSYRKKGLLVLMSKVQLDVQRDQANRLRAQGYDQFQHNDLDGALQSFQELIAISPRDEEGLQMTSKVKIHLGEAALDAARKALRERHYDEATKQADKAIKMEFEIPQAQKIKAEAAHPVIPVVHHPKPVDKKTQTAEQPAVSTTTATTDANTPPTSNEPHDPTQAMIHYRKGLAAIRTKEYRVAIEELDTAWRLDPSNERIYLARERAHQEGADLYSTSPSGDTP